MNDDLDLTLISFDKNQQKSWSDTLSMAVPNSNIQVIEYSQANWRNSLLNTDLVFIIMEFYKSEVRPILEFLHENKIPAICSVVNPENVEVSEVMQLNVRGYVNLHSSIVNISEAIRIVSKGGIYIDV